MRQHTLAYVSIRQRTSAYVSEALDWYHLSLELADVRQLGHIRRRVVHTLTHNKVVERVRFFA